MGLLRPITQQSNKKEQKWTAFFVRKLKRLLNILIKLPLFVIVVPIVIAMRLLRPLLLVRYGILASHRIGHFAGNTELYLCERDAGINVPDRPYIDIFFLEKLVCNQQLLQMWKRHIYIFPLKNIFWSIQHANRLIPGGAIHEVGENTQQDRDVHNLLDQFPAHLKWTIEEENRGRMLLSAMGIPRGSKFVCLIVRDSAYLDAHQPNDWSYHNYRDSNIQNYSLAAESLVKLGYYVIRMGVRVHGLMGSNHPKVIDYATNGMRSDFMDIYLGANCAFCISTSTGFDAVPVIFRRPIVYVNMVPIGYLATFRHQSLGIVKHHHRREGGQELTMREIFHEGIAFSLRTDSYEQNSIELIENTPEEIRDIVVEMVSMLDVNWQAPSEGEELQSRFNEMYKSLIMEMKRDYQIHGDIRIRFGTNFLSLNRNFLN